MKKSVKIIILILLICLVAGGITLNHFLSKVKMNTGYVNGNTAGNLYNNGTFCEYNGKVYFANPDDNNTLYVMDTNGKNAKKICDDTVFFINVDDHYIYYARNNTTQKSDYSFFSYNNNSLCRISKNGGKITILDEAPSMYVSLVGNYLYYLHYDTKNATTLYRICIDGTKKEQLSKSYIYTCSALGQYLYYNGMETDGGLYQLDSATNSTSKLLDCNCYKPIVTGSDNVYYLDVSQNNALVHNNIDANMPTTLTNDSIDLYNVYGSYIYFQVYDEKNPRLCRIKNDGSDYEEILSGTFCDINVTSNYIYFTDYKSRIVYYTSTTSPGLIEVFHPGKE